MTGFRVGETVNITITGAVVRDVADVLGVTTPNGASLLIDPTSDAVTVERVHPSEWPPKPADVWLDRDGDPWFCADNGPRGPYLVSAAGLDKFTEEVVKYHGPLTLAYRFGADVTP